MDWASKGLGSPTPTWIRAVSLLSVYFIQLNHRILYIKEILLREKKYITKLETYCFGYLFQCDKSAPNVSELKNISGS